MVGTTAFLDDPEWLPHRYVEDVDAFRLLRVPREDHEVAAFLTDEGLGSRRAEVDIPTDQCLAKAPVGTLHFLFHSAFCGSTMLIRGLSQHGVAMGLSEPQVLNDVVGFRRRGAEPAAVARVADAATRLLARPFAPDEAVIVKPSNIINPLARMLLGLRMEARAVFLYAPLETFLVSVANKGMHCRIWVRELLLGFLREGVLEGLGFTPDDLFRQSDLQIAAVGWLAQQRLFNQLGEVVGPRLASLDADRMMAEREEALTSMSKHYGLQLDVVAALASPAFSRHSKSGTDYSVDRRQADYERVRAAHEEEITMAAAWARVVADRACIPLNGFNPLLRA